MGTVKDSLLLLLAGAPKRYSELVAKLSRPDKTIYTAIKELTQAELVIKNEMGEYTLTEKGIEEAKNAKFRQEGNLGQYLERESDLEVIVNAKTALALRKTLVFLFDSRYLCKNFPGKFDVKLSELETHAEVIKRLLQKYDPTFDLAKEQEDEEKYLHWQLRDHIPGFTQLSQWLYKNWFSRVENVVSLVASLPPGDTRDEIVSALLAVCKVAHGLGLDTNKLEYRLSELLTP